MTTEQVKKDLKRMEEMRESIFNMLMCFDYAVEDCEKENYTEEESRPYREARDGLEKTLSSIDEIINRIKQVDKE